MIIIIIIIIIAIITSIFIIIVVVINYYYYHCYHYHYYWAWTFERGIANPHLPFPHRSHHNRVNVIRLFQFWLNQLSYPLRPKQHERTLEWRHNERDGVSNHRRLDCLLNRLFRRRSNTPSKLRVTDLWEGNPSVTASGSPHKGPVKRKMFPFDDAIMF